MKNPKRATIKRIEATLLQHRQIARSSHTETIFRLDLPDLKECSDVSLQKSFDLLVPANVLSPSYTYLSQNFNPPIGVNVRYELILDVKVGGLFTNFKITVPVIVGTEPMTIEQQQLQQQQLPQQHLYPPLEMPIASAPVMEYDEPPPSYETVFTTEKV